MSWTALLAMCAGCYACKAAGPLLLADRSLSDRLTRLLALVPIPILAALVAVQTVGAARAIVVDARLPALGVAAVLVWRRAPFLVVILAAALTAAAWRVVF